MDNDDDYGDGGDGGGAEIEEEVELESIQQTNNNTASSSSSVGKKQVSKDCVDDARIRENEYLSKEEKKQKLELGLKLHQYARAGIIEGVIKCIQDGVYVDYVACGNSALSYASYYAHNDIIRLLVQQAEANVDVVTITTPLGVAIERGLLSTVKLLIALGANPAYIDTNGKSLLYRAIQQGDMDIIKALVDTESVDLDIVDSTSGNSLLHDACSLKSTSLELIEYLIVSGVPITTLNTTNQSILHRSVISNNIEVFKYLSLNHTNLLDLQDSNGYTALILASFYGYDEMVRILLEQGADSELVRTKDDMDCAEVANSRGFRKLCIYICGKTNRELPPSTTPIIQKKPRGFMLNKLIKKEKQKEIDEMLKFEGDDENDDDGDEDDKKEDGDEKDDQEDSDKKTKKKKVTKEKKTPKKTPKKKATPKKKTKAQLADEEDEGEEKEEKENGDKEDKGEDGEEEEKTKTTPKKKATSKKKSITKKKKKDDNEEEDEEKEEKEENDGDGEEEEGKEKKKTPKKKTTPKKKPTQPKMKPKASKKKTKAQLAEEEEEEEREKQGDKQIDKDDGIQKQVDIEQNKEGDVQNNNIISTATTIQAPITPTKITRTRNSNNNLIINNSLGSSSSSSSSEPEVSSDEEYNKKKKKKKVTTALQSPKKPVGRVAKKRAANKIIDKEKVREILESEIEMGDDSDDDNNNSNSNNNSSKPSNPEEMAFIASMLIDSTTDSSSTTSSSTTSTLTSLQQHNSPSPSSNTSTTTTTTKRKTTDTDNDNDKDMVDDEVVSDTDSNEGIEMEFKRDDHKPKPKKKQPTTKKKKR